MSSVAFDILKTTIQKEVFEAYLEREWTIQGLGMLRTYLVPENRLHVWD